MAPLTYFKFVFLFLALASCAGTGTKSYQNVNAVASLGIANLPNSGGQALILRENAWVGGGALVSVNLNGERIAKLGNGEVVIEVLEKGQNTINAKIEGIQGVGLNTATYNFVNDGAKNYFFIIGIKTGLLMNELVITETVENSWKRAQN